MGDLFLDAAIAILGAIVAVGIAVVTTATLWGAISRIAPHDYHDVPMLQRLAVIGGLILAIGIVVGGPTARSFMEFRLFASDGPWNLTLAEFLAERILVPRRIAAEIGRHLAEGSWGTIYPAASGATVILGAVILAYRSWRDRMLAMRAAIGTLLLGIAIAIIGFYSAEAILWLIHKANFWALAILTWVYQRRRYATHH